MIKTWQKRIHKLEGEQGDGFLTIQQAMQQEIDDLRQAIEQAGKQKIEAIARVDDLERGGRVRALALGLGLDEILYARINHEPN
jgi:low affinity Fe/Cu permease